MEVSIGHDLDISRTESPAHKQQQFGAEDKAAYLRQVLAARSECLTLSTSMRKKLPREIRDLIYAYICLDDRQLPIGPYHHYRLYNPRKPGNGKGVGEVKPVSHTDEWYLEKLTSSHERAQTIQPDGRIRTDHDVYPADDLLMPEDHVFHPSYVGKEVALETLKMYYERNSFSICNVEGGLDSLCAPTIEGSGLEFVPLDHIRDLQIRIKCERCTEINLPVSNDLYARLSRFAVHQEPALRSTVESLTAFRHKIRAPTSHSLDVEIVLMSDLIDISHGTYRVVNMLQTIRNLVYELLYDRENTTVRVTHLDEQVMAFPRNYTGLFKLTEEQWGYEKSRQEPNHDWSQDFWLLPVFGNEMDEKTYRRIGGYYFDAQEQFLAERWGISDIIRETNSTSPIAEGFAWPAGCAYHPGPAKELIDEHQRLEEEDDAGTETVDLAASLSGNVSISRD